MRERSRRCGRAGSCNRRDCGISKETQVYRGRRGFFVFQGAAPAGGGRGLWPLPRERPKVAKVVAGRGFGQRAGCCQNSGNITETAATPPGTGAWGGGREKGERGGLICLPRQERAGGVSGALAVLAILSDPGRVRAGSGTAGCNAGPEARRPGGPEARRPGGPEARRPGGPEARRPGGPEARRPGGPEARRPGGPEARRPGGPEARRPGGYPAARGGSRSVVPG
jgi:hypothetical protein